MKRQPPPHVPGNTEAERFDNAVRKMFSVSKEDILMEEKRQRAASWTGRASRKKRAASKKPA